MHRQRLLGQPNDVDDANGCGSGGCGGVLPFQAVAERFASFALVMHQRFSRCAVAADFAVASACDIAFAVAASCSAMVDVAVAPEPDDSSALECEEIGVKKQCR